MNSLGESEDQKTTTVVVEVWKLCLIAVVRKMGILLCLFERRDFLQIDDCVPRHQGLRRFRC